MPRGQIWAALRVYLVAASVWSAVGLTAALAQQDAPPQQGGGEVRSDAASSAHAVPLEPVTVTRTRLREEALVGANAQPEWTTRRRFSETRIYVLPPWQLAAYTTWQIQQNRSMDDTAPLDAADSGASTGEKGAAPDAQSADSGEEGGPEVSNLLAQEFELGLPYRFQIEYQATGSNETGEWQFKDQSIELRYALADWGKIPLNPTLFGEWKFRNAEADSFETKLLLGDEITPGWHGGVNLFFEQQVGDHREQEIALAGAISSVIIDERLSLGMEMEFSAERDEAPPEGESNDFKYKLLIGPSLQWRPLPRFFVDVVPLVGATNDSPVVQSFVIVGIDFNTPDQDEELELPAPIRTK